MFLCFSSVDDVNTVVDQYIHGDEEVKNRIEERFGKVTIKRLIDDASSLKWQKENCQECPCCRSPIEVSFSNRKKNYLLRKFT